MTIDAQVLFLESLFGAALGQGTHPAPGDQ